MSLFCPPVWKTKTQEQQVINGPFTSGVSLPPSHPWIVCSPRGGLPEVVSAGRTLSLLSRVSSARLHQAEAPGTVLPARAPDAPPGCGGKEARKDASAGRGGAGGGGGEEEEEAASGSSSFPISLLQMTIC